MSKQIQVSFLALGLIFVANGVWADEVTRSTSTQVDSPDQSSSSNTTTTTEDTPTTVKQDSTTTETAPGVKKQVTTSKRYVVPKQKTVVRHTESETVR